MKIAIVTQPLKGNYGGFLQNFALQQVLKKLGHKVVTIDYIPHDYTIVRFILSSIKTILFSITPRRRKFIPYTFKRTHLFDGFVRKNINVTEQCSKYKRSMLDKYGIQAVITGSDQVWRPMYNDNLGAMFLDFVPSGKMKKVAYAASFGVDNWEYTPEETELCKKLAQEFDVVTVREASGVDLCKKHLTVQATEVLDPTLLLNKEDYENVCSDVACIKSPFLASYVLDLTLEKKQYIEKIAEDLNLPLKLYGIAENAELSIEEWIAMFRDAAFVVTDSFHGSVFSIIFNKPFISIGNENRGLSRFQSILDKFGLLSCLTTDLQTVDLNAIMAIDWLAVNTKRKALQDYSIQFLKFLR